MRNLIILLCLCLPAFLTAQLKKADKLYKKGKFEKALLIYDEERKSVDSVELVAAHYGYLKTFSKLNPKAGHIPATLELQHQTAVLVSGLSKDKKRTLAKDWRVSSKTVETQEKLLMRRMSRTVQRSSYGDFFDMAPFLTDAAWSDTSRSQLELVAAEKEGEIMDEELRQVRAEGLSAYLAWVQKMDDHSWRPPSVIKARALREQLVREVVNDPKATYEQLREVYNNHFKTEAARNPRFRSLIASRLYDKFVDTYSYSELHRFIKENPKHWVAQDCYVDHFVEMLEKKEYHRLTGFLQDYPNSILGIYALIYIKEHYNAITAHPETDLKALEKINEELELRREILIDKDTSLQTYQELVAFIKEAVPAPRAYNLFKTSAQLYLENRQWDRLDDLVEVGLQHFTFGQPEDCDVNWVDYQDKQKWLRNVKAILATDDCDTSNTPLAVASQEEVDEYSPVLTADGKVLYFSRFTGIGSTYDIVQARLGADGGWGVAAEISALSNPKANEVPLSVNAAGNELLLFLDGRLAVSKRSSAGWSAPVLIEGTVADEDWHGSATLSPDGRFLIFESNFSESQQATVPDTDLFLAKRTGPFSFDLVAGLRALNTLGRDHSPYMSYDGRTLYFSSDKRNGLGGMDVYVTRRQGDGWADWSEPENFGKCVNSFLDDTDFRMALAANGRTAFLGVNDPGVFLNGDIVATQLPPAIRPVPFRSVSISVGTPDNLTEDQQGQVQVIVKDAQGNEYTGGALVEGNVIVLVPENEPDLKIELKNQEGAPAIIQPTTIPFNFTNNDLSTPVTLNTVEGIKTGVERIRLLQYYAVDQFDFEPSAPTQQQLEQAFELMKDSTLNLSVHAYADNIGTPEYNKELCQRRANIVQDYLVVNGISPERIKAIGHGSIDFLADNDSEEGRRLNRRVELSFVTIR